MMSSVQRKIEDRSGASLSVALLFFLVCAIVGSILIAAASVAIGRMKNIEKGEQERYAVDSAMNLISEKMEGGEITFHAEMPEPLYVQRDDKFQESVFTSVSSWVLKDKYVVDEKGSFRALTIPAGNNLQGNDFHTFRDTLAAGIFQNESDTAAILNDWFVGNVISVDDEREKLSYSTPDTRNWMNLPNSDFMYITDQGNDVSPSVTPFVLSVGDKDACKVKVLFCMDAQFNISAVIYPNDTENPKNATMYRIVMIPAKETTLTFDPGITEVEDPETRTVHDADGNVTTETIMHIKTFVQHKMDVKISWGKAVKSSVLPTSDKVKYPQFFPKRFSKALTG